MLIETRFTENSKIEGVNSKLHQVDESEKQIISTWWKLYVGSRTQFAHPLEYRALEDTKKFPKVSVADGNSQWKRGGGAKLDEFDGYAVPRTLLTCIR